jgi:hypothetical protein
VGKYDSISKFQNFSIISSSVKFFFKYYRFHIDTRSGGSNNFTAHSSRSELSFGVLLSSLEGVEVRVPAREE